MTRSWIRSLVIKHRGHGVVVDTNLLLLLLIGSLDRKRIGSFGRIDHYTASDFDLLRRFLSGFATVVTTPNVMSEVSNLLGRLPGRLVEQARRILARDVRAMDERYVSTVAASEPLHIKAFLALGVTDAVLLRLAREGALIVTDDLPLYDRVSRHGFDCVNFTHVRDFA